MIERWKQIFKPTAWSWFGDSSDTEQVQTGKIGTQMEQYCTVFYFSSWQGAAGTSVPNFSMGFYYVLLICGGVHAEHRQCWYFCTVTVYPIIGPSSPAMAGRGQQKNNRSLPSQPPHAKHFGLEINRDFQSCHLAAHFCTVFNSD